jgi:hypothetical protein
MTGPEAVPRPKWSSSVAVRLNLVIGFVLIAMSLLLGVVMPCSGADLCLGGGIAGWLLGPAFVLLVALALSGFWGRSIGLALFDIAVVAAIVGLSSRTILAVDIGGMLAISAVAVVPLVGGVLATREAGYGRIERWLGLGGLIAFAAWFAVTPEVRLGALVPIAVLPALAVPKVPPWPAGAEPEPGATLVGHGQDREE